jgi:hypothetical protein
MLDSSREDTLFGVGNVVLPVYLLPVSPLRFNRIAKIRNWLDVSVVYCIIGLLPLGTNIIKTLCL